MKDTLSLIIFGGFAFVGYFLGWWDGEGAIGYFCIMVFVRFVIAALEQIQERQNQILENQLITMGKSESFDEDDY